MTMIQHIKKWDHLSDDDSFASWLLYLMEDANIVTVIPIRYLSKPNILLEALVIYTLK